MKLSKAVKSRRSFIKGVGGAALGATDVAALPSCAARGAAEALAAGVTWLVVRYSPSPASKPES